MSASLMALTPQAAHAESGYNDVPAEHWARKAVGELVDKYGVMAGFPDGTFKGERTITRYEAAAAFYRVMLQLADVQDLTKRIGEVALEDQKTMKTLHDEFQQELESIKKQQGEQADKIKEFENSLAKLKEDLGSVRFGGRIDVGAEDVFEDNFRPGYSAYFSLNMRIAATDATTIRSALSGSFSSIQEANTQNGVAGKKSQFTETKDISVGFGEAWFDHRVGGFLNPRVMFGFMGVTRMITPFATIPNRFGDSIIGILDSSAVGRASPNLFGSSRGIRLPRSFIAGATFNEGFFSGAIAASPDVFFGQVALDLGIARLKLVSEGDQAIFIGEPVLDTLHNHTAILDIGNDTIGLSAQATFRGLADQFDFRGAASNFNWSFGGFSIGAAGKYEAEQTYQQLIAGVYFSTPSNLKQINDTWADVNIPSALLAVQSPFTVQNGQIFEGSPDEVGDLAGFMVQLSYDNPIIPNLTLEFGRRQKAFGSRLPQDSKYDKTAIAIASSFVF